MTDRTDKELLEKAAKAAGYRLVWGDVCKVGPDDVDCSDLPYVQDASPDVAPWYWNPLTDDGDALRLAVKLGLSIDADFDRIDVYKDRELLCTEFLYQQPKPTDRYAATRRAIIRAAAAMSPD